MTTWNLDIVQALKNLKRMVAKDTLLKAMLLKILVLLKLHEI